MNFFDKVDITVTSGKGGDGLVSGRREKYEAYGGPAGGDGGKGGSVIFVGSENSYTLMPYRYNKHYKAPSGQPGQSKQKYGKAGEDLRLEVPIGTVVRNATNNEILGHITKDGQEVTVARGGRGGVGNMHFATATNQYPTIALHGEPGEEKQIILELQLLGDLALIGTPSVGKSTLINTLSNQQVKTAAYEFTTLVPHLGVVAHKESSFIVTDIPGLIAGAHKGKGLGNVFLRHILKARLFAIVLDMSKEHDGMKEAGLLLDEITTYIDQVFVGQKRAGHTVETIKHTYFYEEGLLWYRASSTHEGEEYVLMQKGVLFVINKYDLYDDQELREEYATDLYTTLQDYFATHDTPLTQEQLKGVTFPVSAMSRAGLPELLDMVIMALDKDGYATYTEHESFLIDEPQETAVTEITDSTVETLVEEGYINEMDAKYTAVWRVYHPELARLVYMLPWGNDAAEQWFWQTAEREGILKRLRKAGARRGDILRIVSPYAGVEGRYILRD